MEVLSCNQIHTTSDMPLTFLAEDGSEAKFLVRAVFMKNSAYLLVHQRLPEKRWKSVEIDGVSWDIAYNKRPPEFTEDSTKLWLEKQ